MNSPVIDARISDIAVIVVNYGVCDLALKAVESVLERTHGGRHVKVHLVDNASPGDDVEHLRLAHETRAWADRVILWPERDNHGFGCGNNVVLEHLARQDTPPDAVFLLNPDAWMRNEAIDLLAAALEENPQAAAAGASIQRPNAKAMAAAFRFPGPVNEIVGALNLGFFDALARGHMVSLPPDQPAGPVDWVSGACVMFRFEAVRHVGFFDPGFFLYYEEVDLMRRLNRAGWSVLYIPQAQVVHDEAAATGYFAGQAGRQRNPVYIYQSWAHYFSRTYGRGGALAIALLVWPASVLQILHRRLRGRPPELPLSYFSDHWRHVIWPLLTGKPGR